MKPRFKKKKDEEKSVAREHITSLLEQAIATAGKNITRANRYVVLARKISSRLKVPIPAQVKRSFCKACGTVRTSTTARMRLNNGKKTYVCLKCGSISRVPYK
ncbi:MAG TPA: ribonuclease P [Candidatus Nanoarchaeia archaeon]|nr:ribonuclease P [Candidatus Nanoarchaeia archaeon]